MPVKRMMSVSTSVVLKREDPDTRKEEYYSFPINALVSVDSEPGEPLVLTFIDLTAFNPATADMETLKDLDLKRAVLAVKLEVEKLLVKLSNPK